jgi:D-sedoheptulose 7-phosphate isomerase
MNIETTKNLEVLYSMLFEAIKRNKIVYFFGNGGSAAESTHIAAEFTSFCVKKHKPWGAVSLNDSVSALTAISNDFGFESVFARQLLGLAKKDDLVIALSTSGQSKNVIAGLQAANEIGCSTVLLTSDLFDGKLDSDIDLIIKVNSKETTKIQETHLFWLHTIIEYLETTI